MPLNLLDWSIAQFQSFTLILMRVGPILFLMPVWGSLVVPSVIKAGLALVISLLLLPLVKMNLHLFPGEPFSFVFYLGAELMTGLILGLAVKLVFAGIQLAGEFAGYQMGLAMASILDPQTDTDTTLVAQFYYLLGLFIFLAIDGHHWFIQAIYQSFTVLRPGELHVSRDLYRHLLVLSGNMFIIAVKILAPVMAVLIFSQIGLGMVAKMVPQVNVLVTSFPITIGLGLLFLGLSADFMFPYMKNLFQESCQGLFRTLLPLLAH